MEPITTWYKRKTADVYTYNHFTEGHTQNEKDGWMYKNCYLDTSSKINKVIEKTEGI